MSEVPFKSFNFDGVLGLGLDGLSETPEFNFLNVIAEAVGSWGGSRPNVFAVFLAETLDEESEITFGGWAKQHLAEPLKWNSMVDPSLGHWSIEVTGLLIDGQRLDYCKEGCRAVVDTGTSLLAVPTKIFPELYEGLKHPAGLAGHCLGHGPELQIELEHFTVRLGPEDYARLEQAPAPKRRPRLQASTYQGLDKEGKATRSDMFCKPMMMTMDLPAPLGPKLFILG